jgi:hypothetical protein
MFANKNTIQINTSYYNFALRGPNYAHLSYVPQIFVSRVDANTIEIIVYINERNSKTKSFVTRQILTYKEKLSNVEDYFRSVQNSNFKFALPNSLLFLEKVIKAIQSLAVPSSMKLKSTSAPAVTATPTTASSTPIYFLASQNYGISSILVAAETGSRVAVSGTFQVTDGSATISNENSNTVTITPVSQGIQSTQFVFTDSASDTNGYILWSNYQVYPDPYTISVYNAGSVTFFLDNPSPTIFNLVAVVYSSKTALSAPFKVTKGPAEITDQEFYYAFLNLNLCTVDKCMYSSSFSFSFTDGTSVGFSIQYINGQTLPYLTS